MRFRILADMGAYFLTSSGGPLGNAVQRVAGPYAIENMDVECLGVVTNKPPTGPYRGAGGPEAAVLIERMVDMVAADLGMDPVVLRKLNFIPADAFPYETATGLTYDSGDFGAAFDRALALADYDAVRREQRGAEPGGPLTGIGVATVVKASGGKAGVRTSNSRVRIDAAGLVHVYTDVSPHGQGTATSFAQIAADALGIPPEHVRVYHGDTDELEAGNGTTSSRGLAVGGSAAYVALQEAREKVTRIGAHLLGREPDGVVLRDGTAADTASGKSVTMAEIAAAAQDASTMPDGLEPGLTFEVTWTLPANPFAFAAHIAVVEVDPGTGDIRLVRYAAVHDCGLMINPRIVRGQIQGGITQGIGQALSEAVFHDADGQPLAGSFMTYGMPHTESTPDFVLEHLQTPSPTNPLGIKGIGELPTVASPVAVANAVVDALSPYGVRHLDMPISPEAVWRALNEAPRR
jgi:carbon-monoxide dehydrogenase large subunit